MGQKAVNTDVSYLPISRVRFFKKIQDRIKSKGILKRILRFFTKQIDPRSVGSRCIKGIEESTSRVDSSVPLMHIDESNLGFSSRNAP